MCRVTTQGNLERKVGNRSFILHVLHDKFLLFDEKFLEIESETFTFDLEYNLFYSSVHVQS